MISGLDGITRVWSIAMSPERIREKLKEFDERLRQSAAIQAANGEAIDAEERFKLW